MNQTKKKEKSRKQQSSSGITFADPEPCSDPVDGSELISDIFVWIRRRIYLPEGAADAIALWIVLTWFVGEVYFAPILALLSPTKRSGKSNLLDLVARVSRRGHSTSGVGVTPAVIFRLNDQYQPTLIIDEAEKLKSTKAAGELIGLLNQGHRKGGKVQRCREKNGSGWEVDDFDAFGFRAIALIGEPWDTLQDRSITIPMQRKPRDIQVDRFDGPALDTEAAELAARLARWTNDNQQAFSEVLPKVLRPDWLNDRECDNWSGIFAVAELAGGKWPARAQESARMLASKPGEDGDLGERLIHDIRSIFDEKGYPEAIQSGSLVRELDRIETSPWGDISGGRGLTPNRLARRLKPFGVRPKQFRTSSGEKLRGYWYQDLEPVFLRYPPPVQLGQTVQREEPGSEAVPLVPLLDPQVEGS